MDFPKVSRQVLADVARHLQHVQAYRINVHAYMHSLLITSSGLVLDDIIPLAQPH